ncbi:leucyl aminopeptidase family protein [Rhizorhabdus dicambivorans]|uniref:Aminopeptidase n=1 Tax=Rhizorhabdus dicambivorans TaxID=1850238 RepID=A0A2A4G339_9SPHN|nr:leucyl aminopeptidase family protein [Rhizorhabdus dicambivorans]ATE64946.1 aminopeptidase [Rhizorhabdus dicambivorans]PCE44220.1 aminopeptidase [Rhizorhabdus dicambivorans]
MTDFASLLVPDRGEAAHALAPIAADGLDSWLKAQPAQVRTLAAAAQFKAKPGELLVLPGRKDGEWSAVFGAPKTAGPWDLAAVAQKLPAGTYRIEADGEAATENALGWLLAHHRFDRYLSKPDPIPQRVLLSKDVAGIAGAVALAEAVALVRDLVDTPAADLGPAELAAAVETVAKAHGAAFRVTKGDALDQGYPMIAAVGRAAVRDRAPRLIELEWGDPKHPRIAIVGKGVCFDSGGLDIKPSSAMLLMKKDMGGAAHALALAGLVMGARLPVRLHLLIPAVENAVAGDAFRPGDILQSRKGLSVEIGNTDAEGRLVLGDALTRAGEEKPVLMLDFATLTGAARVALGPDLPALFANDDSLAAELLAAAQAVADPLWRMPLWGDYADMLKSTAADINNAGEGGMAGAVTAALFLQRFVPDATAWAHIDTFAWRPAAKPGRPKGGDALGMRAAFAMLKARFVTA